MISVRITGSKLQDRDARTALAEYTSNNRLACSVKDARLIVALVYVKQMATPNESSSFLTPSIVCDATD